MNQPNSNKTIIILSIFTTIIIIFTSFSSVIGFETIKSGSIESPLFIIREKRATNQLNSEIIKSEYIGKQKDITFSFPIKNNFLILFQEFLEKISVMNDILFNKFLDKVISKLSNINELKTEDISLLKNLFHFVRNNPDEAKKFPFDMKKHSYTIGCPPPTFAETPGWCFKLFVCLGILIVTFPIWFPIYTYYVIKKITS